MFIALGESGNGVCSGALSSSRERVVAVPEIAEQLSSVHLGAGERG